MRPFDGQIALWRPVASPHEASLIRVAHIITGLDLGGAEVVLLRLLERMDRERFKPRVLCLAPEGVVAASIREQGVELSSLGFRRSMAVPALIARTARWLASDKPDVVQTWMYHADLVGGLAAKIIRQPAVVWGLHATLFPPEERNATMRAGLGAAARLSRWVPNKIVCCAHAAKAAHERIGYDASKMVVIHNGFESHGAPGNRLSARWALGIDPEALVVARIGRAHPQKDHATLLAAVSSLVKQGLKIELLIAGAGTETLFLHGANDVHLLGPRKDVDVVYDAADLTVSSSSFGEALPLVLGESMGRGVPVVTTDVGDSALVVGDPQRVVPAGDPWALAAAIRRVLELSPEERDRLGERDRERIQGSFSIDEMVRRYELVYEEAVMVKGA